jgi:hypothetical protein
MWRQREEKNMNLKPAIIEKVRKARCALRAEGKDDTQDAVIEKLGHGSKTTMVKYFPFTIPETAAVENAVDEQECNQTGDQHADCHKRHDSPSVP